MLTISGKSVGSKRPLFSQFSIAPPQGIGEGSSVTLRHLISLVVGNEVAEFEKRQLGRQLIRVLTRREISAGEEAGKIESGGSEVESQSIDKDHSITVALEAFEDGLYLVVVDEQQQQHLDDQVFLRPDSDIAFLRLTMLAGG